MAPGGSWRIGHSATGRMWAQTRLFAFPTQVTAGQELQPLQASAQKLKSQVQIRDVKASRCGESPAYFEATGKAKAT